MPGPDTWSAVEFSTASDDNALDALLGGTQWTGHTISYSFPSAHSSWSTDRDTGYGPSGGDEEPWLDGYEGLTGAQQTTVISALASWAAVADIQFQQVAESSTQVGDLRFAFVSGSYAPDAQAFAYLPEAAAYAGDVWFNRDGTSYTNAWTAGSFEYMTALHEIGHALGLKHPFEPSHANSTLIDSQYDALSYTLMSYQARVGDRYSSFDFQPTTPMVLDVLALQHMYGANMSWHTGDDTYSFAPGTLYHQTIWDAGGFDAIEATGALDVVIDLRGGLHGSHVGKAVHWILGTGGMQGGVDNLWIAFGAVIENASSGSGADLLIGNDVANRLRGGAGNDTLDGGLGIDTLDGGDGVDTASFATLSIGVSADLLRGTVREGDSGGESLLGIEHLEGSESGDWLRGDAAANRLEGAGGDDTLEGGAGRDTLRGGEGSNTASYARAVAGVTVATGIVDAQATGGAGPDVLENIVALIGSGFADRLSGDYLPNTLDGGAGSDTLRGGYGNDEYVIDRGGDVIVESANEGYDTVRCVLGSYTLAANIEVLVIAGNGAVNATGNAQDNLFFAGAGDNRMDGGDGIDILSYVDADAAIRLDLALHAAQQTEGSGADTVRDFEHLVATRFGDTLHGNEVSNRIEAGGGDDTLLAGSGGEDTLAGGDGFDRVTMDATLGEVRIGLAQDGSLTIGDGSGAGAWRDTLEFVETVAIGDTVLDLRMRGEWRLSESSAQPEIAVLADGSWVLVQLGGDGVVAPRFAASGEMLGEAIQIDQSTGIERRPAVAALADGGFLVSWEGNWSNDYSEIFARRFDANGIASGDEFQVNTAMSGVQSNAAVAALADGGYVIAWVTDGSWSGIHSQRYAADGTEVGSERRVNVLQTEYSAQMPTICALSGGGYVIGWQTEVQGSTTTQLRAHVYGADGKALGGEVKVNANALTGGVLPDVAALPGGGFAFAWFSATTNHTADLHFRRFDAEGNARGGALDIAGVTPGGPGGPVLEALPGGGLLLAWTAQVEAYPGAYYPAVYGQRIAADGSLQGGIFALGGEPETGHSPALGVLADGSWVAAWVSTGGYAPDHEGVYARHFGSNGKPIELVHEGTPGADRLDIAGNGALIAAGGAGDDTYVVNDPGDRLVEEGGVDTVESLIGWTLGSVFEHLLLREEGGAIDGTGNQRANRITGNASDNVLDGRGGADTLDGGAGSDTASYAGAAGAVSAEIGAGNASGGAGSDVLIAIENLVGSAYADQLAGDTGSNRLGGGAGNDTLRGGGGADNLDGGLGSDVALLAGDAAQWRFGALPGGQIGADNGDGLAVLEGIESLRFDDTEFALRRGGEQQVNQHTLGAQGEPAVTGLAGGGAVIAWTSWLGMNSTGIVLQVLDADRNPLGPQIRLAVEGQTGQNGAEVAALDDGTFVVTWNGGITLTYTAGAFAQHFAADGSAMGDAFPVSADPDLMTYGAVASALPDGGFVLVWQAAPLNNNGGVADVYAQRYDVDGVAIGEEFVVNTRLISYQGNPAVASLDDGGFVIVWTSGGQDGDVTGVYGQRYGADGQPLDQEFRVNTFTARRQEFADIAVLADGGFVVTWESDGQDGSGEGVYAQRFDASGVRAGGEFRVNTVTAGDQQAPALTALADGGFVVLWQSNSGDGSDYCILGRRYDADGHAIGSAFLVNSYTQGAQDSVAVASLGDGGFLATWSSPQDGSATGIYMQGFDSDGVAQLPGIGGTAGNDWLDIAGPGGLQARGGAGDDSYVVDDALDQTIEHGGEGHDAVHARRDWTLGGEIEDLVLLDAVVIGTGNALDNLVLGSTAANRLRGLGGDDTLRGGTGRDTLEGASGADSLDGGAGGDSLSGARGADTLGGGTASDTLNGGEGADAFLFDASLAAGDNIDTLVDFLPGTDRIQLDHDVFTTLAANAPLPAEAFRSGSGLSSALDADDRLLYDSDSGLLYYDRDGTGAAAAVPFARVGPDQHPPLGAGDFIVIA